ncbi:MAG: DUF2493 domain-containing protein [Candidatus Omnitrophica bacterium]|jgi:hypothetical protein|nr:DUF2493 domain-containing protein [Candidatus Omnitrophota bacterium]
MKTIIAGSRDIVDYMLVCDAIQQSGFEITEVISGAARGVDRAGEIWAKENHVPLKQFFAQWEERGKSAGYIRNAEMVDYAEALIAVTNGSKGTAHTIDLANKKGIKVFVLNVDK